MAKQGVAGGRGFALRGLWPVDRFAFGRLASSLADLHFRLDQSRGRVAPTIARLLGLEMKNVSGRVLTDVLR